MYGSRNRQAYSNKRKKGDALPTLMTELFMNSNARSVRALTKLSATDLRTVIANCEALHALEQPDVPAEWPSVIEPVILFNAHEALATKPR